MRLFRRFLNAEVHEFVLSSLLMKWLITGGCGFLGTSFVRRLMAGEGHSARVLDNLSVGDREDLGRVHSFTETPPEEVARMSPESGAVELVVGDIMDEALALRAAEGADAIVHLAANTGVAPSVEDPRKDCLSNVVGTLNLLEAARHNGVGRFVLASSGAALGEVEPPLREDLPSRPVSPYGASKLAGEAYCSAYFRTFGVETVALRFGNVYGPGSGRKNSAVAKFIRRAMNGEALEIYGDGTQTRDFIYIDDLTEAVMKAATTGGVGGEVFQIATNSETSVEKMVEELKNTLAASGIKNTEVRRTSPRQGDVMRNYSDTSKAGEMLGWQSSVALPEGLRRTVEWFQSTG